VAVASRSVKDLPPVPVPAAAGSSTGFTLLGGRLELPHLLSHGISAVSAVTSALHSPSAPAVPPVSPPTVGAAAVSVVTYLRQFLLERAGALAEAMADYDDGPFPLQSSAQTERWLKEAAAAELVEFLASNAWYALHKADMKSVGPRAHTSAGAYGCNVCRGGMQATVHEQRGGQGLPRHAGAAERHPAAGH